MPSSSPRGGDAALAYQPLPVPIPLAWGAPVPPSALLLPRPEETVEAAAAAVIGREDTRVAADVEAEWLK